MSFKMHKSVQRLDFRVIPIEGNSKGPRRPNWTNTELTAAKWVDMNKGSLDFESETHHRYGVVLDADTIVIDVDVHAGQADGYVSLDALNEELGFNLYSLCDYAVTTPSGGMHMYFKKHPEMKYPGNSNEYPSLDFLSVGKQVIGPGSNHVNGGIYEVDKDTTENGLCKLPEAVHELLVGKDEVDRYVEELVFSQEQKKTSGSSPLDDFNTSSKGLQVVVKNLQNAGYKVTQSREGHFEFVRPGKTDMTFSISGTLGRKTKAGNMILKNFSSSDPNFPSDGSITLSEAARILGNLTQSQLVNELLDAGFGERSNTSNISPEELEDMMYELVNKRPKAPAAPVRTGEELEDSFPTITCDELIESTKALRREYVIDRLLRKGEVANIIAAPKVGKSWLIYNMAVALSTGGNWLGYKAGKDLKVLICDNELHKEELGYRVNKVCEALKAKPSANLQFNLLRGSDVDVYELDKKLEEIDASRFDIIVIDAFYRILPKGTSENDNSGMTQIFNKLDHIAAKYGVAIINIHHSSKGGQGDKSVTDVGAGAGAISRAADTHIAIREHAEEGLFVIDAVTRSNISPPSVTAKFIFPLWTVSDVEPELKSFESGKKSHNEQKQDEAEEDYLMILSYITNSPDGAYMDDIKEELKLELTSCSNSAISRKLKAMMDDDECAVKKVPGRGGAPKYKVIKST